MAGICSTTLITDWSERNRTVFIFNQVASTSYLSFEQKQQSRMSSEWDSIVCVCVWGWKILSEWQAHTPTSSFLHTKSVLIRVLISVIFSAGSVTTLQSHDGLNNSQHRCQPGCVSVCKRWEKTPKTIGWRLTQSYWSTHLCKHIFSSAIVPSWHPLFFCSVVITDLKARAHTGTHKETDSDSYIRHKTQARAVQNKGYAAVCPVHSRM